MLSLIDRYILREMLPPFLLGLLGLNGVLLAGKTLTLSELLIDAGVGMETILKFVASLLPTFLLITIPMSFLLAVLTAFGRLSADSEIIVMKSAGLGLNRLLRPVFVASAFASLLTLTDSLFLIPSANRNLKELLGENLSRAVGLSIQEGTFNNRIPGIVLYCRETDRKSRLMRHVMVRDDRGGSSPLLITARTGKIDTAADGSTVTLSLQKGTINQVIDPDEYRILSFDTYRVSIPLPRREKGLADDSEMTLRELRQAIARGVGDARYRRELHLQIHKRFALPVSCFIFGLIGISLGIVNRRSGKGGGFVTSLTVFVTYFLIFSFLKSLGQKGTISPAIAIWTPNLLFLTAALLLYLARLREIPLGLPGRWRR